jgi:hypothetical protein
MQSLQPIHRKAYTTVRGEKNARIIVMSLKVSASFSHTSYEDFIPREINQSKKVFHFSAL